MKVLSVFSPTQKIAGTMPVCSGRYRDDIVHVRSVKHIVQCLTEFFCLILGQGQTLEGYPFR